MDCIYFEYEVAHLSTGDAGILAEGKIHYAPFTGPNAIHRVGSAARYGSWAMEAVDRTDANESFPQKARTVLIAETYCRDRGISNWGACTHWAIAIHKATDRARIGCRAWKYPIRDKLTLEARV